MWTAEVRAVLDTAQSLRLAAGALGARNPQGAAELLKKADAFYFGEELIAGGTSEEEATKAWSEAAGMAWEDQESREHIYAKMAEYRKMEQRQSLEQQKQHEARAKLTADLKRNAQNGVKRRPSRGRSA